MVMTANRVARIGLSLLAALLCLGSLSGAQAQENVRRLIVAPGSTYSTIDAAMAVANPGDVLEVHEGVYAAPLIVEKSISLVGVDYPVIDGQGTGSLVIITAPDTRLEGFVLRNSGTNINHEDTAIVIQAPRVTVANNVIEDVLFGIYFADASEGVAQDNTVRCLDRDLGLRGDGIRVWYSNNVTIAGNDVASCRDTLIWYSQDITIENNTFRDNRYGLHFMYSSEAIVTNNTVEGNSVGSYLMYSQHLTMTGNRMVWNRGPSGYGIALKEMDYATVQDNVLVGNRAGLYIDDSPSLVDINNFITGNFFGYNDIGIASLPSTERNVFQSNIFLENNQQVSVLGRGNLLGNIWQQDGIGNYWSDYVGYDGDNDGVGDIPYRAEKLFESLTDSEPVLRLFAYSPASQAIDFAASAFPSLRPDPKVIDEAPIMQYVIPASAARSSQGMSLPSLGTALVLVTIGVVICILARRGNAHRRESIRAHSEAVQTGV